MATMCPVGTTVQPDPHAAPRYRAKYAAYRQLAEHLDKLPAPL
jgi:L-xylulokinase